MRKVLYVATYGDFFSSFQINNMKLWQELGCEVHCAADFSDKNYNRFTDKIDAIGVKKHQVDFVRTPFSFKNIKAFFQLKRIMTNENINILDTHNPVASILSRIAANLIGIDKVMYTVHGFFFYKGASLKKNLLFKPVEFFMARLTDVLIVTNLEDYEAAQKMKVRENVYYVPGVGVATEEISNLSVNVSNKKKELGIPENSFVLCSVGECIKRKNHESAIRAFSKIYTPDMYYIVVGDGLLFEHLNALVKELKLEKNVLLPGYRKDANEILKISDLYLFPSYQEGLSVALMQAMAAGLPVVASRIRGNVDCIIDGKGGITVSPTDIDEMSNAISLLRHNNSIRSDFGNFNVEKVKEFSKVEVYKKNFQIFSSLIS
ncbi:glycosyltransferase family 4 protein [Streptococcus alactolyticus]|uniref:glycosyltransferase family 4 protein n=1 Tax=Streptococcus alactolyticus TaxID=29389 RepID=UPI001D1BD52F|nr:glycosyltransferase family 4 protein [Streptococcus alactolyticus]MBM6697774.1 glycosyltransferase family 4 protein [Streptococcus alactolyticus]